MSRVPMTPEIERKILEQLMDGDSLRKICKPADMPHRDTVNEHLNANAKFAAAYLQAKEIGLDEQFDGLDDLIAGEKDVQRARLMWDNKRWQLSKLAPKRFGDKVAHEHSGPDGGPIDLDVSAAAARISAILADAAQRRDTAASAPATPASTEGAG